MVILDSNFVVIIPHVSRTFLLIAVYHGEIISFPAHLLSV